MNKLVFSLCVFMAEFISNTAIGANTSNVSASELAKVEAEAKKVTKEQK